MKEQKRGILNLKETYSIVSKKAKNKTRISQWRLLVTQWRLLVTYVRVAWQKNLKKRPGKKSSSMFLDGWVDGFETFF